MFKLQLIQFIFRIHRESNTEDTSSAGKRTFWSRTSKNKIRRVTLSPFNDDSNKDDESMFGLVIIIVSVCSVIGLLR